MATPGLVGKVRLLWALRGTYSAWTAYWQGRTPEQKRRLIRSACGVVGLALAGYVGHEYPELTAALARVLERALP